MGIFMGYLCLLCLLLLAAKFAARKTKREKVNSFFEKLHKPVSCIFLLLCVIHLFFVFPVLKGRNLLVTVSGIIGFGIAILLILLCHTIKDGKRKMFWHRTLTIVLLAVVVFHVTVYVIDFMQYKNDIKSIRIAEVDMSAISDGKYIGDYDAGYIYAKVQITVKNGKITGIEVLEHRNERGQKAESIVEHIVEEQRLEVDAITGATNSGLVIEKACENALNQ